MINGAILVGDGERHSERTFRAIHPADLSVGDVAFSIAEKADVTAAAALAEAAFVRFASTSPGARAAFLEAVAEEIIAIGPQLIETAHAESGLPVPRLEGERGRTVGQLRLFAATLRRGDWLDVVIEEALHNRTPLPRSDLRRFNYALGPVAVFGASNFPLAFSVAGGDTASALAAGCPVVVKGHPAHPGTGELVARAVLRAVSASGLPPGVFSYLPGTDYDLGGALVSDSRIKAVGFTGSRAGGLALAAIAAARPEPIPVYAEMSSVNPVAILPGKLQEDPEGLAAAFIGSLTLGAGQFCTNPGLTFAIAGPEFDRFIAAAGAAVSANAGAVMLTPGIRSAFEKGVARLEACSGIKVVARGQGAGSGARATASLFVVRGVDFAANPDLAEEIFGAASLIVECADFEEMKSLIAGLEGQLTATIHFAASDETPAGALLPILASRAGRVLANGWPTGVEVCEAMVHGGPYPSTSDGGRSTSVGTLALQRFVRPVCYQDVPDGLLPEAVRDSNPWRAPRRVNGQWDRSHTAI